jgi:hypothetical protein
MGLPEGKQRIGKHKSRKKEKENKSCFNCENNKQLPYLLYSEKKGKT